MTLRTDRNKTPGLALLLLSACAVAVLLSAGCGDRGGGYVVEQGTGGPGPAPDTTPPAVLSTSPGANDTAIPINAAISVTFSEAVAPATVTNSTFVVTDPTNSIISGSLNTNGTVVTFTPAIWLSASTAYTATLSSSITDLYGNHLVSNYPWTFTTDSKSDLIPPTIADQSPANTQTNVALSSSITVTFSEPIDPATITASTVTLSEMWGVPVSVNLSLYGSTLIVTPASQLKFRMTYTVCITTGATDLAGNALPSNQCWNFTTVENSGYFKPYIAIPIGSRSEAVAMGDVTGDGKNDVVLVTSYDADPAHDYHVFLFAQKVPGGLATAVTCTTKGTYANSPKSVAIGDINDDGKSEIVVGNSGSNIEIFSLNSTGILISTASYTSADSSQIRIADLNHDGRLDIVGIGAGTNTATVFLQNASNTMDSPVTYAVTHEGWDDLDVGDVNNDALIDIIIMSGAGFSPNIGVLIQKTNGTFEPAVYYDLGGNELAGGVAVGDVNGDSMKDVVISFDWSGIPSGLAVFSQNPSGTLNAPTRYTFGGNADAVEIADVNIDGRQDIILRTEYAGIGCCLQTANGIIAECEFYQAPDASFNRHGMAIGDINDDGMPDIAIADYWQGLVIFYHE